MDGELLVATMNPLKHISRYGQLTPSHILDSLLVS
jgi:hypothetical protein